MKFYAGIGSRETPFELKPSIKNIVEKLSSKGYVLRSGGANGADSYFEEYADVNQKEIYLPWENFNNNKSSLFDLSKEAFEMAKKYHPYYEKLSPAGKKFMARNCYQVLGKDLKTPVEFIVCWTKDGKISGGTGQAMRIANDYGIKIYNLKKVEDCEELLKFLEK